MSKFVGAGADERSQAGPPPARQQLHYIQISSLQYPLSFPPYGSQDLSKAGPLRGMNTEAGLFGIDFESRVEIELKRSIEQQFVQANTLLKSVLFTQSRLMWHLRGMAEFYFMLQGNAMHWFSAAMFSKVQDFILLLVLLRWPTQCSTHSLLTPYA